MRVAFALVLCLLGGVVLAGLTFPLIGGLGLLGQSVAEDFSPQKPPPLVLATSSTILDRNGGVLATLFTENRRPIKLREVPLNARNALIAIEDNRFYEHRGVDVKGTLRALARNSSAGSVQQGGSTLTQQYVKNMLISSASTEEGQKAAVQRSLHRKIQEARYALYLEQHETKDQILEGYFNIAYYGSGVYGIGTAASHYFAKPVGKLTLAEGALLAGMVQNPRRFDPSDNAPASITRRNVVLSRMRDLHYITPAQAQVAEKEPLRLHVTKTSSGCEAPGVSAPFFCDYVRRYLENGPAGEALGATRQERQQRLLAGGLTIRTTLDPKVQKAAQDAVSTQVPPTDPFHAVAVADTVEPGTGNVRAMAVDRSFGEKPGQTKVNFAIGGSAGFQGGSTFKAFVLARALQMGISTGLTLHAPQSYCPKAFVYKSDSGKCPQNAGDSEAGTFNMAAATAKSVNTYFIQLEERTGLVAPPQIAESLGVRQVDGTFAGAPLPKYLPSFVLGTPSVSPLAMAAAYAAFGAHGKFCPPRPVESITDALGHEVKLTADPCTQALEPKVADTLTALLRGVLGPGGTAGGSGIGRPAAGKTGTTNDAKAAWFIGYTPQLSTAVWVGKSTPAPMRGVTINGRYYRQVFGGSLPAPIWQQVMRNALDGVPVVNFTGGSINGPTQVATGVPLPVLLGLPLGVAASQLRDAGYAVEFGGAIPSLYPAGTVAAVSPSGSAAPGSTVMLWPSNGHQPVTVPPPTAKSTQTPPTFTPSPTASPTAEPTATASPTATAEPTATVDPTKDPKP
ncbi:MAG: glycosyl transferase, family 51 [Frankiales bacterium]|nr:glycosyl transferase, family 51 [Frankiales bacterium]